MSLIIQMCFMPELGWRQKLQVQNGFVLLDGYFFSSDRAMLAVSTYKQPSYYDGMPHVQMAALLYSSGPVEITSRNLFKGSEICSINHAWRRGRGSSERYARSYSEDISTTLPSAWRADCHSLCSHALSPAKYVGRHSGSNYYLCA